MATDLTMACPFTRVATTIEFTGCISTPGMGNNITSTQEHIQESTQERMTVALESLAATLPELISTLKQDAEDRKSALAPFADAFPSLIHFLRAHMAEDKKRREEDIWKSFVEKDKLLDDSEQQD